MNGLGICINRTAAVLAVLFFVSGCVSGRVSPSREAWSPELRHEIYLSLLQRKTKIQAFRGQATLRYRSALFRHRGELIILVKRPLDFRFDGLSEFGLTEEQMVSHAGQVTIYWPQQYRYYLGLGTREEMTRFISLALTAEELIDFLLTSLPLEDEEDYQVKPQKGGAILLAGNKGRLLVKRAGEHFIPLRFTALDLDGGVAYRVYYEDYQTEVDPPFPRRMKGTQGGSNFDLHFTDLEINPSLEGRLFEVSLPQDAIRIYD